MDKKYEGIIDRPYNGTKRRPHMSEDDRAAQFAPFAALSGHGNAIRQTEEKVAREMDRR